MNFSVSKLLIWALICVLNLTACHENGIIDIIITSSDELNTSEIELDMSIMIKDGTATAVAELAETVSPGAREISLGNGDKLYVEPDISTRVRLTKNPASGDYEAEFTLASFLNQFTFILERKNHVDSFSNIIVPNFFSITFPSNNAVFSRTESVQVTWDNPDLTGIKQLIISLSLTCNGIQYGSKGFASIDDGEFTIPSGEIEKLYPDDTVVDVDCDLSIIVLRREIGSPDPNLHQFSALRADRSENVTVTISTN